MKSQGYISEQEFDQKWGAHAKPNGELWSWQEIQCFPISRLWTVYESGSINATGHEDRTWYAMPSIVSSWAIGYLVTEKSWSSDTPHAVWYLDEADEEEREEYRQFNLN